MARKYEHAEEVEKSGIYPYMLDFVEWTKVKGFSEDTARRREAAIRRFIHWSAERSINRPQDVTRPILERYQKHLFYYRKADGTPLSYGSQQVMLTPLKTFFKWLTRENHILYNPASELMLPKKPKRLPKTILPVEDVESVINQADIETDEGMRDRAIMEVFYSTGIRRMELVKLSVYDVDTRRQTIMINEGKGRKDRLLPIGKRALKWVEKYTMEARPRLIAERDDGTLFLTDEGRPWKRDALTAKIKKYIESAGIKKTGSCHLFRHAMATHMLDNGADIRFIQAMLGHADLSTTEIYTQVSIEKLREIHAATHPAAKTRR